LLRRRRWAVGAGAVGLVCPLRLSYSVESVEDDAVTLTEITCSHDDTPLRSDRGSLRFLGPEALATFLTAAGFTITTQYGDRLAPCVPHLC
jgi:hypothetical protein